MEKQARFYKQGFSQVEWQDNDYSIESWWFNNQKHYVIVGPQGRFWYVQEQNWKVIIEEVPQYVLDQLVMMHVEIRPIELNADLSALNVGDIYDHQQPGSGVITRAHYDDLHVNPLVKFFQGFDYLMLRKQKDTLQMMLDSMPIRNEVDIEQYDALQAIISTIDEIQDTAVASGLFQEEQVFEKPTDQ